MTNLINDFINLNLVEGDYYFVINPEEDKIRVMRFRIENKDDSEPVNKFGVLEDSDTVFNSVYHKNLVIKELKIPAEYKPNPIQAINKEIIEKISEVVEDHPDWRFQQILQNMGIIYKEPDGSIADTFYETSEDTLKYINETMKRLSNCN